MWVTSLGQYKQFGPARNAIRDHIDKARNRFVARGWDQRPLVEAREAVMKLTATDIEQCSKGAPWVIKIPADDLGNTMTITFYYHRETRR